MNFTRLKKRGQTQDKRKTWMSPEGYRIVWRNEAFGVKVPAVYQASVDTTMKNCTIMDRVGKPTYSTLKKAEEACDKHYALWSKACEQTCITKIRNLIGLTCGVPTWAVERMGKLGEKLL